MSAATANEGFLNVDGRALVLVGPEYEDLELLYPLLRLKEAGMNVTTAGIGDDVYKGKHGYPIKVDTQVSDVVDEDYDVVVIPGGVGNPDKLRTDEDVLRIVRRQNSEGRVLAAVCHAGWVLISAAVVDGRSVTGYHSIKDDLVNAGADYQDQEVVVDENLITSRDPHDLPAFCRAILDKVARRQVTAAV